MNRRNEMRNREQEVRALARHLQALELRKAGVPYAVIAERLGFRSASGAWRAVQSALRKTLQEPADELRKLELERLDSMLLAIAPRLREGDLGAIDRALRIMERRAKLLGLDAAPPEPDRDVEITFEI